jgi:hypothetical protein
MVRDYIVRRLTALPSFAGDEEEGGEDGAMMEELCDGCGWSCSDVMAPVCRSGLPKRNGRENHSGLDGIARGQNWPWTEKKLNYLFNLLKKMRIV